MRVNELVASLGRFAADVFGRDLARPVEWISLLMLAGWFQFLITKPEVFALPRYVAFSALQPAGWAAIIGGIIMAQLVALGRWRHAGTVRFLAMALATGIWAMIALFFWSSVETAPLSARQNTVMAAAAFVTAVYLGIGRGR